MCAGQKRQEGSGVSGWAVTRGQLCRQVGVPEAHPKGTGSAWTQAAPNGNGRTAKFRSWWSGVPSAPRPAFSHSARPGPHDLASCVHESTGWLDPRQPPIRQAHISSRGCALLQEWAGPPAPPPRAKLKALSPQSHDVNKEFTGVSHSLLEGLAAACQLWGNSRQLPDRWPPRWPHHHRVCLC